MKCLEEVKFYFISFSIALFITITSCSVGDDTPPNQITDLRNDQLERLLEWTAPGDNGNRGRASLYFIRFFNNETLASLGITLNEEQTCESIEQQLQDNFGDGIQIPEFIQPQSAESPEDFPAPRFDITGDDIFCYLIQSSDEVGNLSKPSNATEVISLLESVRIQDPDSSCPMGFSIGAGNFTNTQEDEDDGVARNDTLIGDPCRGIVYVFFGRSNISKGSPDNILDVSSADVTIIGSGEDGFGASVTGIGNFGGSGSDLDEIGIGAPEFDSDRGEVFIIFGNNEFPTQIDLNAGDEPDFLITGENQGDEFGLETVGFANVDRRGDEFFVGAPAANSDTGKTYRFTGNDLSGDVIPASDARGIIIGQLPGDLFGSVITDASGIGGSSSREYAISSVGSGKVNVFFSNVSGTKDLAVDTSDVVIIQGNTSDRFGTSVSGGGDIDEDGDGKSDLIVGAPGANTDTGSVFLYSGEAIDSAKDTGTEPNFSTEFIGIESGDLFGTSLVILNNLTPEVTTRKRPTATIVELEQSNADFAVGTPGSVDGREFIFLGIDDFPPVVSAQDADVALNGIPPDEMNFGLQTQALGDVNGDMIEDFGASGNNFVRIEF